MTEHREILRVAKVNMLGAEDGEVDVQSLQFLNAIDELIQTREQEADPHMVRSCKARSNKLRRRILGASTISIDA